MTISFRDQNVEQLTEARSSDSVSPSLVAKRDLARYYALLRDAEKTLNLTPAELNLIYDVCNGTIFDDGIYSPAVELNVSDALTLTPELAKKWKVDATQLLQKLHSLTALQQWALIDKIERFWIKD